MFTQSSLFQTGDSATPLLSLRKPVPLALTTTIILLSVIVLSAGCAPFGHLIRISPQGLDGPQASQCGACHVQAVKRRTTQGTNALSNILVSFEDEVATRSHAITLDTMANYPGAVTINPKFPSYCNEAGGLPPNLV